MHNPDAHTNPHPAIDSLLPILAGKKVHYSQIVKQALLYAVISFPLTQYMPAMRSNWAIPPINIFFQLIFLLPVLCFHLKTKLDTFLYKPRKENFLFIITLSYSQRKALAILYLKERIREIGLFCLVCILVTVILQIQFLKEYSVLFNVLLPISVVSELFILYFIINLIVNKRLYRPTRRDLYTGQGKSLIGVALRKKYLGFSLLVAQKISAIATGPVSIIIKRQILYFFSHNFFMIVLINTCSLVITIILILVTNTFEYQLVSLYLLVLFAPCVILSNNVRSHWLAVEKLYTCTYYCFQPGAIWKSNLIIAGLFCLPYMILAIIITFLIDFRGGNNVFLFFNFSISLFTVLMIFSRIYLLPEGDQREVMFTYFSLIILHLGICFMIWGFLFSLPLLIAHSYLVYRDWGLIKTNFGMERN